MEYVRLGKSNLMISRVAFGAMSLTKAGNAEKAAELVRSAYNHGINFFDTSRNTPACEKLLGDSLGDIRSSVVIASKTSAQSGAEVLSDLETSLNIMHTDSIDLYQYESDSFIPEENGIDGIYSAFKTLKNSGKIRSFGLATTDFDIAEKAISCGLYDTIQFPFSMISSDRTRQLVQLCRENDIGFIAMQPLCGGILTSIPLAYGFLHEYENVVPLWGAQTQQELDQILYFNEHPPVIDEKFNEDVEKIRAFFS